eukprot:5764151-Pyramimonas_sp.AAC.1
MLPPLSRPPRSSCCCASSTVRLSLGVATWGAVCHPSSWINRATPWRSDAYLRSCHCCPPEPGQVSQFARSEI